MYELPVLVFSLNTYVQIPTSSIVPIPFEVVA